MGPENKTKYMLMNRHPAPFKNVNVHQFSFEQVENFKYLGANINHKNNMHIEIKSSILPSAANRKYYAMNKMFTPKLLSRDTKKKTIHCLLTHYCHVWM